MIHLGIFKIVLLKSRRDWIWVENDLHLNRRAVRYGIFVSGILLCPISLVCNEGEAVSRL
jgi:hypothetical protein